MEIFPHQSEQPASRRVSSCCLVAQPHDGVDLALLVLVMQTAQFPSTSNYLFILI